MGIEGGGEHTPVVGGEHEVTLDPLFPTGERMEAGPSHAEDEVADTFLNYEVLYDTFPGNDVHPIETSKGVEITETPTNTHQAAKVLLTTTSVPQGCRDVGGR